MSGAEWRRELPSGWDMCKHCWGYALRPHQLGYCGASAPSVVMSMVYAPALPATSPSACLSAVQLQTQLQDEAVKAASEVTTVMSGGEPAFERHLSQLLWQRS